MEKKQNHLNVEGDIVKNVLRMERDIKIMEKYYQNYIKEKEIPTMFMGRKWNILEKEV